MSVPMVMIVQLKELTNSSMVTHYGPPDLSKIENLLKKLVSTPEEKREKRVLERYIQLAGFVQNGQMVNKDKEFRARQWVAEQERIEKEKKPEWHQTWWWTLLLVVVGGAVATIVGTVVIQALKI